MKTIILSGWFIIKSYTGTDHQYNYLLEEPRENYLISASLDKPLSYGEDTWIKLKVYAQCEEVMSPTQYAGISIGTHICNAKTVQELKCTPYNSIIINGIPYC